MSRVLDCFEKLIKQRKYKYAKSIFNKKPFEEKEYVFMCTLQVFYLKFDHLGHTTVYMVNILGEYSVIPDTMLRNIFATPCAARSVYYAQRGD